MLLVVVKKGGRMADLSKYKDLDEIMCMYCKNSTVVESTTTHVVNYNNCIIIVKNVPCLECDQCGERYYTEEVTERLETIVNMAKKLMQEIAVIDYRPAA